MAPLSLAALGAALLACTATSGSAAVVYLVGCFGLAALRLLAGGAGFLGFAYLLVYVGAIAILALFAVMLTEAGAPRARPRGLSVPATGLGAPPALIEAADLVTEMGNVKHHFSAGVKAQEGIEY